jgi:hypothetical protein
MEGHMRKIIVLLSGLLLVACTHGLEIKNLDKYQGMAIIPEKTKDTIGLAHQEAVGMDVCCQRMLRGVGTALSKRAEVVPYSPTDSRIKYAVQINSKSEYKGSFWNWFPINWPGFLIFTPAWNGYVYKASFDVDVSITDTVENRKIESFSIPIKLNLRHADMDRTWTEIGWLEYGVIPLVSGIFFISYDPDVTPELADKIEVPIGEHIAEKIISRINDYKMKSPPSRVDIAPKIQQFVPEKYQTIKPTTSPAVAHPTVTHVVAVTWTSVNIRSGAGNEFPIVTMAKKGDKLSILGEYGDWFNVRLENGQEGWINNRSVK